MLILVVNTGGSSTKLALYQDLKELASKNVHVPDEWHGAAFDKQLPVRFEQVKDFLVDQKYTVEDLDAVACRGGLMAPLPRLGTYEINDLMCDHLLNSKYGKHDSNLSALIGQKLKQEAKKDLKAYICDPVTVDEMPDYAREMGVPGYRRLSRMHALNIHCVARKAVQDLGISYDSATLVVAHLGTGNSIASIKEGRIIDVNNALLGEGPFSVERAGTVPLEAMLELCYSKPKEDVKKLLVYGSGFKYMTGVSDFKEISKRASEGEPSFLRAVQIFVYQLQKFIASAVGAVEGKQQAVVITGALIQNPWFAKMLVKRLQWLGNIKLYPGEFEMEGLATGVYNVLSNKEQLNLYRGEENKVESISTLHGIRLAAQDLPNPKPPIYAVGGGDNSMVEMAVQCCEYGIGPVHLVDTPENIKKCKADCSCMDLPGDVIVEAVDDPIKYSVDKVFEIPGASLMKGKISTDLLLKEVLKQLKERTPADAPRPFISHTAVLENPMNNKLILVTDGGITPLPNLKQKIQIINNSVEIAKALGIEEPNIGLLAGMEDHGQDIPAIVDARELMKMFNEGKFPGITMDGPFGIDVFLSRDAAKQKGIKSLLAGDCDILMMPNLEAGNVAVKTIIYYHNPNWAGLIIGGPIPIILGSRSDTVQSKILSASLARLFAHRSKVWHESKLH